MRLLSNLGLLALCWRLSSAHEDAARLYFHNPPTSQAQEPSGSRRVICPTTARLVMAERMGVIDFHSADLRNSEEVLAALNEYSLRTPMFSNREPEKIKRALLYVEGEKNKAYLDKNHLPWFAPISDEPSSQSGWNLYDDLRIQSQSQNHRYEFHDFLEDATAIPTIQRLMRANYAITILYLPLTPVEAGARAEWGTYTMPNSPSLLKRSEPVEDVLELASDTTYQPVQSSNSRLSAQAQEPLRGILPACFPSLASCQSLTRNCTGHGSCARKYEDLSSDPRKSCYACQCAPSEAKDSEGRVSTTYWGGPACQKRDVSVQFWLIALFTIGMVGLVSFAVGSVWGMGEEELPSVIGAGVSGPVARK